MSKIKVGLCSAAFVLVVTEWLMLSHSVTWSLSAVLPH